MPGETEPAPPTNCWIMSSEDEADDTLVPLLKNHDADMDRVFITDEFMPMEPRGLAEIERLIREREIGLLVIDSLTTWMGGETDTNSFNQTAAWLRPFKAVAQRTGCAIVFVRHRRKANKGENALHSGLGSMAQVALFRTENSVWEKDGNRYFKRTKGNIGKEPPVLRYELESVPDSDLGRLKWAGEFAEESTIKVNKVPKALKDAVEWLRERLAAGPVPAEVMMAEAKARNISDRTMRRAKIGLVNSYQEEGAAHLWVWRLAPRETVH